MALDQNQLQGIEVRSYFTVNFHAGLFALLFHEASHEPELLDVDAILVSDVTAHASTCTSRVRTC